MTIAIAGLAGWALIIGCAMRLARRAAANAQIDADAAPLRACVTPAAEGETR
ncbi:MAG: hypothetical protein ACPGVG_10810 [Mycobacterium sp.]